MTISCAITPFGGSADSALDLLRHVDFVHDVVPTGPRRHLLDQLERFFLRGTTLRHDADSTSSRLRGQYLVLLNAIAAGVCEERLARGEAMERLEMMDGPLE